MIGGGEEKGGGRWEGGNGDGGKSVGHARSEARGGETCSGEGPPLKVSRIAIWGE